MSIQKIESFADWELEDYLDNAREAFLSGYFHKSKELFKKSIELCEKKHDEDMRIVRARFGHMLSQSYLGEEAGALSNAKLLDEAISQFRCVNTPNVYFAYGKPILGEEEISIEKCLQRVESTVKGLNDIIGAAPLNFKVRASLLALLRLTEFKAIECCKSGGIWKACLQPLLEKWLELKEIDREWRHSGKAFIVPSWE